MKIAAEEAAQSSIKPSSRSLNQPGIYVYHVGCLTVKVIDRHRPEEIPRVVVAKVGKAAEETP